MKFGFRIKMALACKWPLAPLWLWVTFLAGLTGRLLWSLQGYQYCTVWSDFEFDIIKISTIYIVFLQLSTVNQTYTLEWTVWHFRKYMLGLPQLLLPPTKKVVSYHISLLFECFILRYLLLCKCKLSFKFVIILKINVLHITWKSRVKKLHTQYS